MSIYYCRAKIISRANGQSAVAHAAYISRGKIKDQADNETKDYRKKEGLIAEGLAAPEGLPEWAYDRGGLWNKVQEKESQSKRWKTAQLARSFIIALPCELTDGENTGIVKSIAKELNSRGMIADWAVHAPEEEGDTRNIHAHLITTMREVSGKGFGNKNREWNDRKYLEEMKIKFADIINERLRERGLPLIDGRSYEKQNEETEDIGNWKVPQKHRGAVKTNIDRRLARIERQLERLERKKEGKSEHTGTVGHDRGYSGRDDNEQKQYERLSEPVKRADGRDDGHLRRDETAAERPDGDIETETGRTDKRNKNRDGGYSR
jgi:hypothetical protein